MKITRANVEEFAKSKGWDPIQVDGVPEGFSWKEPDLTIGGVRRKGRIIKFIPLEEFDKGINYE